VQNIWHLMILSILFPLFGWTFAVPRTEPTNGQSGPNLAGWRQ
jgi:hypothetical protein